MVTSIQSSHLPTAVEPFREFLDDIAALGVVPCTNGGVSYGLMRARSNARWWLLPTDQGRVSSASIALYQPASAAARLARGCIKAALRVGITRGWSSGVIRLDRLPRLPDNVLPTFASCSYFTGTDSPHRKTAIQLMDGNGGVLGYAKLSRRTLVRPYLSHEGRMLRKVGALRLSTVDVPNLLALKEADGREPTILVTDSRKSAGVASPLDPDVRHLRFLCELAERTCRIGAFDAYRDLIAMINGFRWPDAWLSRFQRGMQILLPAIARIPVALSHGDFTPWNSFILHDRLYVFDWEYAADRRPVGCDLVHYVVSARGVTDPASDVERLVSLVANVFLRNDISTARLAVLMSLLLHAGFYSRRAMESGGDAEEWAGSLAYGRMIDALLDRGE